MRARRLSPVKPNLQAMEDRSPFDVPTDGSTGSPFDELDAGLELVMAAEVLGDALEAIDVQAIRAGASLDQAVDAERLGVALGRPAGHLLARRVVGDAAGDGIAGTVAREAAGRAGARAVRVAVDRLEYTSS